MSGGWIKLPVEVLLDGKLTATALKLFVWLTYRQGRNGYSWPDLGDIMSYLCVAKNTALRAVRELEGAGWLRVDRVERRGRGKCNHYTVNPLRNGSTNEPLLQDNGSTNEPFGDGNGSICAREMVQNVSAHKDEVVTKKQLHKARAHKSNDSDARKASKSAELVGSFARFWKAYPRKQAKEPAWKAWAKIKPDALLVDRILKAVNEHKRSEQWLRDGGQYIPHPQTWLNQRRWEDEIVAPGQTLTPARRRDEPLLLPIPPRRQEVRP